MMKNFTVRAVLWKICFEAGIDCSSKTMYPDWLSLSGEGYIASMYKNTVKSFHLWAVVRSCHLGTKRAV